MEDQRRGRRASPGSARPRAARRPRSSVASAHRCLRRSTRQRMPRPAACSSARAGWSVAIRLRSRGAARSRPCREPGHPTRSPAATRARPAASRPTCRARRRDPNRPPRRLGALPRGSGSFVFFSLPSTISGALLRRLRRPRRRPVLSRAVPRHAQPANPSLLRPAGCLCRHVLRVRSPPTADAVHPRSLRWRRAGRGPDDSLDYRMLSQQRRGIGMPEYGSCPTRPDVPGPSRSPCSSSSPGLSGSSPRSSSRSRRCSCSAIPTTCRRATSACSSGCGANLGSCAGLGVRVPEPVHRADGLAGGRSRSASRCSPARASRAGSGRASTSASPARSSSSVWLIAQSIYVLDVLCPWCMLTWAVTIPTFWARDAVQPARGEHSRLRHACGGSPAAWFAWVPLITVVLLRRGRAARAGADERDPPVLIDLQNL